MTFKNKQGNINFTLEPRECNFSCNKVGILPTLPGLVSQGSVTSAATRWEFCPLRLVWWAEGVLLQLQQGGNFALFTWFGEPRECNFSCNQVGILPSSLGLVSRGSVTSAATRWEFCPLRLVWWALGYTLWIYYSWVSNYNFF